MSAKTIKAHSQGYDEGRERGFREGLQAQAIADGVRPPDVGFKSAPRDLLAARVSKVPYAGITHTLTCPSWCRRSSHRGNDYQELSRRLSTFRASMAEWAQDMAHPSGKVSAVPYPVDSLPDVVLRERDVALRERDVLAQIVVDQDQEITSLRARCLSPVHGLNWTGFPR